MNFGLGAEFLLLYHSCINPLTETTRQIQENGYISGQDPKMTKIKALCFLQL